MNIEWPCKRKDIILQLYVELPNYVEIMGINGSVTGLTEIKVQLEEYLDEGDFFSVSGIILCSATYQEAQQDEYGRTEIPSWWELTIIEQEEFKEVLDDDTTNYCDYLI